MYSGKEKSSPGAPPLKRSNQKTSSKTSSPPSISSSSGSSSHSPISVFNTKEIKDVEESIRKIKKKQKRLATKIDETSLKLINSKFDRSVLDELEDLEKEEVDLETKHMELCRSWVLQRREVRREYLLNKKHELKSDIELPNPTSISKMEMRLFGHSSTKRTLASELDHDLSTWELDSSEITLLKEQLGKGTFGSVVKGKLRGKAVAVKTIDTNWKVNGEVNAKVIDGFRNECAVMTKLLHPNVLLLMGVSIEPDNGKLIMVTELMPRGSVFDLLHKSGEQISFKQRMRFARDTALGMNWLHLSTPQILHLDLKTQNILVDENWVAKVADFGLSRIKKRDIKGAVGSPLYMAPEVLAEQPYDEKADVFSFGIILCELVSGKIPYEDKDFETVSDVFRFVVKNQKRPTLPLDCPHRLVRLIHQCWEADPKKRPSFKTIVESQTLDEVILDSVISEANAPARTFWLRSFKTVEGNILDEVPWKTFAKAFIKYCNINIPKKTKWSDTIEMKALHLALVPKAESLKTGVVSLEEFGGALEWFGPFTPDERFVKNVCDTIHINGFFGDITSENAERQMAGKQVGTYMLRFSSKPGCYTVTVMETDSQLKHYRIKHRAGKGYTIGSHEYASLPELVKARKNDLGLKRFLGGSKYAQLFVAHESQVDGTYAVIAPKAH